MHTLKLLPRWCRFIGLAFVIPTLLAFFYDPEIVFGELQLPLMKEVDNTFTVTVPSFFDQNGQEAPEVFQWFRWVKNDISNELLLTFMLIGTYLIAFAKIKGEDEFSERLRLESMTTAIIWNSILLLLMNWMFYDGLFLYVLVSQLFSFLLIFSLIFAIKVRSQRKSLANEE